MSAEPEPISQSESEEQAPSSASAPHVRLVPPLARQINLFTGEPEIPSSVMVEFFPPGHAERVLEEGVTIVTSPEGMAVHISGWGAFIGKKSERLVVRKSGGTKIL
jgi:hypothetical protein